MAIEHLPKMEHILLEPYLTPPVTRLQSETENHRTLHSGVFQGPGFFDLKYKCIDVLPKNTKHVNIIFSIYILYRIMLDYLYIYIHVQ